MGTKTISIKDEVYERLLAFKAPGESFSDELMRLTTTNTSIMDLAGAWSDIPKAEIEKMKKDITAGREDRSRLEELDKMVKNNVS